MKSLLISKDDGRQRALKLRRSSREARLVAFALSDRDAIFNFIEAENPSSAILVDERMVAAARRLIDFPASGRVGRIAGTRELVMNGTPYVAASAVTQSAVRILRVLHGAREWPDMIPAS